MKTGKLGFVGSIFFIWDIGIRERMIFMHDFQCGRRLPDLGLREMEPSPSFRLATTLFFGGGGVGKGGLVWVFAVSMLRWWWWWWWWWRWWCRRGGWGQQQRPRRSWWIICMLLNAPIRRELITYPVSVPLATDANHNAIKLHDSTWVVRPLFKHIINLLLPLLPH